jgi:hypothetical protein
MGNTNSLEDQNSNNDEERVKEVIILNKVNLKNQ